jgi:DNA-binding LytR/AlgR family response regulator
MIKIAIVEDEQEAVDKLETFLLKYFDSIGEKIEIKCYKNGIVFLTNYKGDFDIIFMDIEMPHMNGMECAAKLREMDKVTLLIFVTNIGYMAPQGYEVEAFGFVVKPINYEMIRLNLNRAVKRLARQREEKISIRAEGSQVVLNIHDIYYIEVISHNLTYHTLEGDYKVHGSMAKVKEELMSYGFATCNSCYLINMRYVQKVYGHTVTVNGTELQISHPQRKTFMEALNQYIGG